MGITDLFEDHRIVGGFRLALNLNNNDYLFVYENLKRRIDKRFTFQRQAQQRLIENGAGVVKIVTHNFRYQLSYPFSERASLRLSAVYRNDRYVLQASDRTTLRADNVSDHW